MVFVVVIGGAVSLFTSRASSTNKLTLYLFQTRTDWKNKYSSSPVYLDTTSRCEVPGALGSQIRNRQGGRLPWQQHNQPVCLVAVAIAAGL